MTAHEAFALELARVAADVTLPLFRTGAAAEDKGKPGAFDPVTEADRGAEAAMRRLIESHFPDHGIVGEEYGADRPDADYVWVLDPVDGTRAFVAGLPLWTTLIGLTHRGRPVVGAVAQPYLDEVFLGGPSGARCVTRGAETPIATRPCPKLNDAVIATTDPDIFTGAELGGWRQVRATARLARLGCDAYAYAMLASGHIDLVAETGLKPWDWTALVALIEAAGGRVTDWLGETPRDDGRILAVGDAALTDQALLTLRRAVG
ncbi:histidinol-phosphatase [Brevundimonas poindexterae]|uniref:histidinol-phosphatase n=1 Tax=Brevundimonas poindexterae TaxID=74325 RepID=UPI001CFCFF0A|nr:histidinol-phosphatase [Brevundimonas poindexterae]